MVCDKIILTFWRKLVTMYHYNTEKLFVQCADKDNQILLLYCSNREREKSNVANFEGPLFDNARSFLPNRGHPKLYIRI